MKNLFLLITIKSTAVEQAVACASVTQWARVRSPVGTSYLGEVFSGFSSIIKANGGLDFHYHDPFHHYSSSPYIIYYMNLMNNGQMDRGIENPTQHLP